MTRILSLTAALSLAVAGSASAALIPFTSPSGNIDCMMSSDTGLGVDCLVQKATWRNLKPRPKNCPLEWVQTEISIERGKVRVGSCRGDIGPQCMPKSSGATPCRVLGYGKSITLKSLRCTSATSGITCRLANGRGKGFWVAREGYRLF